jgi:hypothetical protein
VDLTLSLISLFISLRPDSTYLFTFVTTSHASHRSVATFLATVSLTHRRFHRGSRCYSSSLFLVFLYCRFTFAFIALSSLCFVLVPRHLDSSLSCHLISFTFNRYSSRHVIKCWLVASIIQSPCSIFLGIPSLLSTSFAPSFYRNLTFLCSSLPRI